jgi:hypothetical protein
LRTWINLFFFLPKLKNAEVNNRFQHSASHSRPFKMASSAHSQHHEPSDTQQPEQHGAKGTQIDYTPNPQSDENTSSFRMALDRYKDLEYVGRPYITIACAYVFTYTDLDRLSGCYCVNSVDCQTLNYPETLGFDHHMIEDDGDGKVVVGVDYYQVDADYEYFATDIPLPPMDAVQKLRQWGAQYNLGDPRIVLVYDNDATYVPKGSSFPVPTSHGNDPHIATNHLPQVLPNAPTPTTTSTAVPKEQ